MSTDVYRVYNANLQCPKLKAKDISCDNLNVTNSLVVNGTLNAKHIICESIIVTGSASIKQPSMYGGTSIDGNVTILSVDPDADVQIFQNVAIQGVLATST